MVIELKNCILYNNDEHEINEFILMENYNGRAFVNFREFGPEMEFSDPMKFVNAIELGLTHTVVWFKSDHMIYKDLLPKNVLINYYGYTKDYDMEKKYIITEKDIENIKCWFNICIEWNKNQKLGRRNLYWDMAYNRYLLDAKDEYIENRFLNIGLILECILNIDGNDISKKLREYTASLCAYDQEEFENIFEIIRRGYKYRCDVVHGNAERVAQIFRDELIYEKYFELREIVNILMLKTFKKTKEEVITEAKTLLTNYNIPV